jgi:pimeloyl-ACP methyl ester carboxylesterase
MQQPDSEFMVGDMHLVAKHWGDPQGDLVIALHGWLDNAASFDFLAPLLPQYHWVCLDLAGHGKSDHRCHFGSYNIWQDVVDVFAVADLLECEQFHLVGHSRGAVVAALAAGTFAARVQSLSLIEGVCPWIGEAHQAPEQLAAAITSLTDQAGRHQAVHPTYERAVQARVDGKFPVSLKDAEALAQRAVETFEDGFTWAHDYKLLAQPEVRLTLEQVEAFFTRIQAPTALLQATQGILLNNNPVQAWLQQQTRITIAQLPGSHHLHMSSHCQAVADWLGEQLALASEP